RHVTNHRRGHRAGDPVRRGVRWTAARVTDAAAGRGPQRARLTPARVARRRPAGPPTATAYTRPGAVALGPTAFGDEPVVVHKGERLRWRNVDTVEHDVVADPAGPAGVETNGQFGPCAES